VVAIEPGRNAWKLIHEVGDLSVIPQQQAGATGLWVNGKVTEDVLGAIAGDSENKSYG